MVIALLKLKWITDSLHGKLTSKLTMKLKVLLMLSEPLLKPILVIKLICVKLLELLLLLVKSQLSDLMLIISLLMLLMIFTVLEKKDKLKFVPLMLDHSLTKKDGMFSLKVLLSLIQEPPLSS
jgi:hypothetical protein